ncbi:hypothetical protein Dac01nite_17920 [Demequina activiva]|uniref:Uncharacterized protein n=1 Tax=Demequina activiva TaxID=1582364 RepID=A0A919Q762_9MICO|nr:hypothetical protein Dac01nite_17920 [Demequina activiva]
MSPAAVGPAPLAQLAHAAGATREPVRALEGDLASLARAGVAANGGARLGGRIVIEDALGDVAIRNAMRVKPEAGVFDVNGHGTPSSVSEMSASELAGAIRARPS